MRTLRTEKIVGVRYLDSIHLLAFTSSQSFPHNLYSAYETKSINKLSFSPSRKTYRNHTHAVLTIPAWLFFVIFQCRSIKCPSIWFRWKFSYTYSIVPNMYSFPKFCFIPLASLAGLTSTPIILDAPMARAPSTTCKILIHVKLDFCVSFSTMCTYLRNYRH